MSGRSQSLCLEGGPAFSILAPRMISSNRSHPENNDHDIMPAIKPTKARNDVRRLLFTVPNAEVQPTPQSVESAGMTN